MDKIQTLTPERITQIKQMLRDIKVTKGNQSLIQNNNALFEFENKWYRCRMPNQHEQNLAEQYQNKFKVELIQQEGTITKKKLIKILKEKHDIDIKELEKEKLKIRNELQDCYIDLAVIPTEDKSKIEEEIEKKNKIEERFIELTIEIIEHLSPCIEEQVKASYYRYLAYLCTEERYEEEGEEKYKKVWKSFDDYANDKEKSGLSHRAVNAVQELLLNIEQ